MNLLAPWKWRSFFRALGLLLVFRFLCGGAEWPQFRGPATDGSTPERIATTWATNSPAFIAWTNSSITNGFSTFAVSGGRAFTQFSRNPGGGMLEYVVALNAVTGAELWQTPIGPAPWDPEETFDAGSGTPPYHKGNGPRTTPTVKDGRLYALSGLLRLVCMNATNGTVVWSNNLMAAYGASTMAWENGASPCLDGELIFVNLHTASDGKTLAAFRTSDGGMQWHSRSERTTHATPLVTTIEGVRQVIFATATNLTSLECATGEFLWKFDYPWGSIGVSMGASAAVWSNIVYCTASYGKGMAGARVTRTNGTWTVSRLYYRTGPSVESVFMTPIACKGHIYAMSGSSTTFLTQPVNCIDMVTGIMKWQTNGFGKGGLILADTNLLALTERGELVLFDANPSAYVERARFQALQFSFSAPGKCWNNAVVSDGRIYARGTRGSIAVNVALPNVPKLKLLAPRFLNATQLLLTMATDDASAIAPDRLAGVEVRTAETLEPPVPAWIALTNRPALKANGTAELTITIDPAKPRQFYRTSEP